MIVETSAFVAVILQEQGWERLYAMMFENECRMSAPSWVEVNMVLLGRLGESGREDAQRLKRAIRLEIVPFNESHAEAAINGFLAYGKGRHPASLNYGDVLSYAIAKETTEPLLFVGDDFPQTDVESAGP
ncbi:type II toxin-antitoxin system VapC family toxin [bacterium]|nr:MAG: type II toxin-antitoxin system VapC family toxin [bacterium]